MRKPGSGLVVEARAVNRLASARPTAACRTAYSNVNGNVAAVGGVNALQVSSGDVWTYTSPTTAGFAGAGTSFAAPQVAGMAVSLLALKPEMTATEVVDVIKSTSVSDGCQGAPIVDAYAAILMLDQEARAPVRTALIRGLSAVQSKPIASEAVEFLQAYYPDAYGIQSVAATLDFGRFDLNGDGITGGSSTARFPRIGTAGMENLTDFQALCGLTKSAIFDQTGMDTFKQHILKVAASSQANSTQVLSTCYDSSLRVSGSATMVVGQRQQLGWEILFGGVAVASPFAQRSDPSMAANLTWQVAGASLSIDGTGAAQALSPGIATVTVSDRSGLRTVFTINIQADATCVVNPVNNTGWASVQRLVCTNYSRSGRLVNITEQTQVAFDGSRHLLVVEEDLTAGNFNFIYFEWDKSGAFIVNGKGGGKTGFGPANSAEYCAKHVCLPNVSIRGAYSPGATNVGNNGGSWGQYRHIVRYTYDARGVFTGEDTLLCGLQIPPTSDTAVYVSRKRSPDPVVHTSQSDFTGCPTIAEIDSINALTLGDSLLHQSGYNYR